MRFFTSNSPKSSLFTPFSCLAALENRDVISTMPSHPLPGTLSLKLTDFFYSAIMYEAKRMLYAKRRLCVLWDFKERTLNALAFAGAQDIVSDTGCQCEQRRQHC